VVKPTGIFVYAKAFASHRDHIHGPAYRRCDVYSRDQAGIGRWQLWLRAVPGRDGGRCLFAGRNEHNGWDQNGKRGDNRQDFLHGSALRLTEAADVTENAGA